MSRQEIILNGLGCTNCAAKMERDISALDVIDNASIDFVASKLTIEASNGIDEQLQETIKSIVHKYEPDIIIEFVDENEHTKPKRKPAGFSWQDHKKEVTKLAIGGVIFATGLIFAFPTWLELVIFLASYLIVGSHVIWRAIMSIKSGQVFSEHFLMAIATIGAFIIGEFAEAVAVMLFYLVGELFQSMAINNSRRSISKLMDIRPDYANKKVGNNVRVVAPQDIAIGDIIIVKPGERIPLDGQVIEGFSTVDTSALTGESMPKAITIGDEALSGYVNTSGLLSIQVSKVYTDSTVAKILDLVENAASKKSPTENFITKFAHYYTPFVVFAALALAFIPPLLIADAQLSDWVYRALVFLVISCPCALVVSIPLGYFAGIGQASKRGILVKGGNYLDALNNVETVVFDKTGTLTKGEFSVSYIKPQNDYTADELLEYAAYAESFSTHPIAVSLVKAYGKHIDKIEITDYKEIAGHGINATIKGKSVLVGNKKLISDAGIKVSENNDSYSQIHVAIDNTYAGYINVEDEIKEDAKQAIASLKASGINQTIMFTGDKATTGEKIGNKLAVDKVFSQMLPADKVNQFEQLIARHNGKSKTAFVGDGINDAPVLARADIGIAMGGLGSDAAIEAADVVIITDQPSKVSSAIKIAKKTRKIVWQNIILALGAKAIVMTLGAVGIATMWLAVFADVGIALLAILNAMRMLNKNAKLD